MNTGLILALLSPLFYGIALNAQTDCGTLLLKKVPDSEMIIIELEQLDSCGYLPVGFYEYPFGNLFARDSSTTYLDLFKIVTDQKYSIEFQEECRELRLKKGNLKDWRSNDMRILMQCGMSYIDALLVEDKLSNKDIGESELSYGELNRQVSEYINIEENKDSLGSKMIAFYRADDFDRAIDSSKYTFVFLSGTQKGSELEYIEHHIFDEPGILYKIYRDFNFYRIDIKDLLSYENFDANSGKLNAHFIYQLHLAVKRNTDNLNPFILLDEKMNYLSGFKPESIGDFIEELERY